MSASPSSAVTPLGYVLLCEIRKEPRGGYVLRRLFETTPLGIFSSSPGSIYPALRRLEDQGLIRAIGAGRGGRFEITPAGRDIVEAWLAQPVTAEDVSGRIDLCLLRFAFLQEHSDRPVAIGFLTSLEAAATARAAELIAFLDSEEGKSLSLHGRLAVDHGRRSVEATARWAIDARDRLNAHYAGDRI